MSDSGLLAQFNRPVRRLLAEHLTCRNLRLTWEADLIGRDAVLNAKQVLPRLASWKCWSSEHPGWMMGCAPMARTMNTNRIARER